VTAPLRKICFENVVVQHVRRYSNKQVDFDKHPLRDRFIGSLKKDMGRVDLPVLTREKYWVAEKSESVRVMLLNLYRSRFPRWIKRERQNTPEGSEDSFLETAFSLKDNCALETTYCYANSGEIGQQVIIQLDDGQYEFNTVNLTLTKKDYHFGQQKVDDRMTDESTTESSNPSDESTNQESSSSDIPNTVIQLERKTGWSFTYLIDENYDFYLCQDEFVFPTYESMKFQTEQVVHQSVLLLDGELVFNLKHSHFNYFITDVITYCISNPNRRHEMNVVSALHRLTSEKYNLIMKHILEPHYYFYKKKAPHIPQPKSMVLLRKKLFEKSHIDEVHKAIRKDAESGDYIYKETNKNEGFIFVPESEHLNVFGPGVNNSLLQWRWPEKKRFFFAAKLPTLPAKDATTTAMSLFYGFSNYVPHLSSVTVERLPFRVVREVDISQLKDEDLEVFQKESKLTPIVELSFEEGEWKAHTVRKDKETPDSFRTIISHFTNMIEDVSYENVKHAVSTTASEENTKEDDLSSELVIAHMIRKEATVHLRVKTKFPNVARPAYEMMHPQKPYEDILLQTYHVVKGKENWVWRKICSAKDCIGPKGEIGDELEALIYQREQQLRQLNYARCVFLPSEGKWKIIDFSGWEDECCCSKTMSQLERMKTEVIGLRDRRRESKGG